MMIERLGQVEQDLQKSMEIRRRKKIAPAGDISDALAHIVDHDGEMIAGRRVLADEQGVTPLSGIGRLALGRAVGA